MSIRSPSSSSPLVALDTAKAPPALPLPPLSVALLGTLPPSEPTSPSGPRSRSATPSSSSSPFRSATPSSSSSPLRASRRAFQCRRRLRNPLVSLAPPFSPLPVPGAKALKYSFFRSSTDTSSPVS